MCKFSLDLRIPVRPYIIQVWYAVLVFKFTSLIYDVFDLWLPRVLECVIRGDVGSGVADCDPQNIWNPWKTADHS